MFEKRFDTWLEIDLQAIQNNIHEIQKVSGLPTAAVIKADAYGLGMIPISQAAIKAGCIYLATARFSEAIRLRRAGFTEPILVLGMIPPENVMEASIASICGTLFSMEQMALYESVLSGTGQTLNVHVKVDSGMGRLGVRTEDGLRLLQRVKDSDCLHAEGLFTHLARADEPEEKTTDWQLDRFDQLIAEAETAGLRPRYVHAANSAASLFYPRGRKYDFVRCGITMYGLSPTSSIQLPEPFIPAISWKAGLTSVKTMPAGQGISYGHHYFTKHDGDLVGVIPVGYADGYRRTPGNQVLVHGQKVPVIGSVCMDQCMIDLNGISNPKIGDEVVLIGRQGGMEITTDDVAESWNTISYEVICGIDRRVSRYYL